MFSNIAIHDNLVTKDDFYDLLVALHSTLSKKKKLQQF